MLICHDLIACRVDAEQHGDRALDDALELLIYAYGTIGGQLRQKRAAVRDVLGEAVEFS